MSARWDRILDRLWLTLCAAALILGTLYLGAVVGVRRRPYAVEGTVVVTPTVAPGGPFRMGRRIARADDRPPFHGRRLQSPAPGSDGDLRRDVLPDLEVRHPPTDLDGRARSIDTPIPADFPRGPAVPVDGPSAVCDGFQRLFRRWRRPDAATPSAVACAGR